MLRETVRFEEFELDPNSFELRRAGRRVKLERIPLQLLFLLAENRERLVPREEILQAIWGKDVFVDADNSINTAVRKARQALEDDSENPRFLRTIPGKGYRFTAQVRPATPSPAADVTELPQRQPQGSGFPQRSGKWAIWAGVALVALVGSVLLLRTRLTRSPKIASGKVMMAVLPFVNLSGDRGEEYFADGMTEEMITQLGSLDPQQLV